MVAEAEAHTSEAARLVASLLTEGSAAIMARSRSPMCSSEGDLQHKPAFSQPPAGES